MILSQQAIQWICIILKERYGQVFVLQYEQNLLCLSIEEETNRRIVFDTFEHKFLESSSDFPCYVWDGAKEGWNMVLGSAIPAPSSKPLVQPLIEKNKSDYFIHYDIIGLVYWMLTRYEEIGRTDLDSHERFPASSSHAFKNNYLERPIVDEWLDILKQVIERQWPQLQLQTSRFEIKVSHDVDSPSRYGFASLPTMVRRIGGDVFKRGDIKSAVLAPWNHLCSHKTLYTSDPYNSFDFIMNESEKRGLRSAFYFITGKSGSSHNSDYPIEHPAIRRLMKEIHQRGHEIGVHPSYGTFLKPSLIKEEFDKLKRVAGEEGIFQKKWGGRMHYLRYRQPETLQAWNDAGLSYDSTLSYADHVGFRCGTCYEYPAFNPNTNEVLDIRIRPLIVMEGSVISKQYMNLEEGDGALAKMAELKEMCRRVNGFFTLLWHNSSLGTKRLKALYEEVLG